MSGVRWTKAEVAILAQIKKSGASLKNSMHLLPGRSYDAAEARARGMKRPAVPATRRIQLAMQDGKERTAREIGELVGLDRKSVNEYMRVAVTPGPNQWAHVARVEGLYRKSIYVYGPGVNAERPDSIEDLSDAQLDAMHRSSGSWWPLADQVVIAAMSAMCFVGRAAA
ncbi:hypothetical protein [Caballeronia zhejiangensis]|uniref:hypothetical protein n=1 Tax=Caballeronia zhejiangensis TaxID=871203 RepID=UPI00158C42BA|nr:hypothetical protein [Caballeronia zhejiangensis]